MAVQNIFKSIFVIFCMNYCLSVGFHSIVMAAWKVTEQCQSTCNTLVCPHIPKSVPPNITNVAITDMDQNLTDHQFSDVSWRNVDELELHGTLTYVVKDYKMSGLSSLRKLVFKLSRIQSISNFSFAGLTQLRSLSFVDFNDQISSHIIEPCVCTNGMLPNLEELIINPGIDARYHLFVPSTYFINQLLYKPLKLINISNTAIELGLDSLYKLILKVDIMNMTNSILVPDNIVGETLGNITSPLMKTLDISGINDAYMSISRSHNVFNSYFLILLVENLYCNNIRVHQTGNVYWNISSHDNVYIKNLYSRNNRIVRLHFNNTSDRNHTIETIDLSKNEIQYMNINMGGFQLLKLLLSMNKLYLMENEPEFEHLLSSFGSLRYLDLAKNNISVIPVNMFIQLSQLYYLNLEGNRLQTISFSLKSLSLLEYLDLRNNLIQSIDGHDLNGLRSYVKKRNLRSANHFELNLHGNPLQCSCESADFIQWFVQFVKTEMSSHMYICVYKGSDIYINSDAAEKSKYLCQMKVIIICSVIAPIAAVCSLIFIIYILHRRKRNIIQKNKVEQFLAHFLSRQTKERFLIFLSLANIDEDFVKFYLINKMKKYLSAKVETDDARPLVCTGNDFRPGFPIVNEAHRFIQDSCVFVAVLSEAFCASEYCRGEVQEACCQYKPIILILLGHIDERKMSSYMMDVFKRRSRAKFVRNEHGEIELVPSIRDLSESVILLAADNCGVCL